MEPCKGVDDEAWEAWEPSWLRIGEGLELRMGEVRVSPLRGGGGDRKCCRGNEG